MSPASVQRGSDVLVRSLRHAGVTKIFTLSGNHIMSVFDATLDSGIELIHTRHEASAVHMADAWARIKGEVGIALVTGGPGHANALSALYTALMAESAVVLLSGHAPNNQLGLGAFQEMAQADMAAPVCKAAWTCAGVEHLSEDIAKAIRIARSGRPGPVNLNLPNDVLDASTSAMPAAPEDFAPQPQLLTQSDADALMKRLSEARRPLILAGPACLSRSGRVKMLALESASNVPVIGMESPRGIADASLGAFAQVLAQSDCILLLNKRLDFTLRFGQAPVFPVAASLHQIDPDTREIERTRKSVGARLLTGIQADPLAALQALTHAALSHTNPDWLAQVKEALAFRPHEWDNARSDLPGRLHPVQMLRPLQALLDSHPDSVLVADGGEIGQWAMACLHAPYRVINGVAGSIGSGLPMALGARCALPDAPVLAVMGDGTVGFHISEFDTAMRYQLPMLAVIGNDARWNAEYQIQLRDYGPKRMLACELQPSDYHAVAQAFGAYGERVDDPGSIGPAMERAKASGLPAMLNVQLEGLPAPQIRR